MCFMGSIDYEMPGSGRNGLEEWLFSGCSDFHASSKALFKAVA
jgi:hypothetical protein